MCEFVSIDQLRRKRRRIRRLRRRRVQHYIFSGRGASIQTLFAASLKIKTSYHWVCECLLQIQRYQHCQVRTEWPYQVDESGFGLQWGKSFEFILSACYGWVFAFFWSCLCHRFGQCSTRYSFELLLLLHVLSLSPRHLLYSRPNRSLLFLSTRSSQLSHPLTRLPRSPRHLLPQLQRKQSHHNRTQPRQTQRKWPPHFSNRDVRIYCASAVRFAVKSTLREGGDGEGTA